MIAAPYFVGARDNGYDVRHPQVKLPISQHSFEAWAQADADRLNDAYRLGQMEMGVLVAEAVQKALDKN